MQKIQKILIHCEFPIILIVMGGGGGGGGWAGGGGPYAISADNATFGVLSNSENLKNLA
jgi:acetyl-CoA carboxylase alpha subunit